MKRIVLDKPLAWPEVASIASGAAALELSAAAVARIEAANAIVKAVVARGIRGYGVNTGVGALSDVIIPVEQLRTLSRNILMSHAVGLGEPLEMVGTRAIMAATRDSPTVSESRTCTCLPSGAIAWLMRSAKPNCWVRRCSAVTAPAETEETFTGTSACS